MKKLLALICAFALVFSFAGGAFASELDFLDEEILSYEAEGQFKITLNKPLDFIGAFSKYLNDEFDEGVEIDIQRLCESIFGTTHNIKMKAEVSEDYLKGKMYAQISSDAPIEFSDDLKIAVGLKMNTWIDYDFTNTENPKYNIIYTNPFNGKYYVQDYLKMMDVLSETGEVENYADVIAQVMKSARNNRSELITVFKNVLEGNAKITSSGNVKTIELNDEAVADVLFDLLEGIMKTNYMSDLMKTLNAAAGGDIYEPAADGYFEEFKNTLKGLDLFAEDALKLTYTFDDNGMIKSEETRLHIDFNLKDILVDLGVDADDPEFNSIFTSENSEVDILVEAQSTYISRSANVTMPVLTAENSVDMVEKLKKQMEHIYDDYDYSSEDYIPEKFYTYYTTAEVIDAANREYYVDIEDMLGSSTYDYDNFAYALELGENDEITVTYSSDYVPETVLKAKAGEAAYTINGEAKTAKHPFKLLLHDEYGDYAFQTVMASDDVFKEMLGIEIHGAEIDVDYDESGKMTALCFVKTSRPNPAYNGNELVESRGKILKLPEIGEMAAIGVIGGADGPTSIFVTK